jgi:hypothetical protein
MNGAPLPDPETFLSGETGHVAGMRRTVTRTAGDRWLDLRLRRPLTRVDELAAESPRRKVLVVGVYRPGTAELPRALEELRSSRHELTVALGSLGEPVPALAADTAASELAGGKFQNLNAVYSAVRERDHDWLIALDDDVALPERFLDRFLFLAERFGLSLAQPAQTLMSHAAWRVTRRRGGSLVRETRFVEIGPVTAFARAAADQLLPFPELRFGWGLDLHWAALAAQRDWHVGIVDATPVRHESAPVASSYPYADAIEEAREFLAERPYVESSAAQETLAVHATP